MRASDKIKHNVHSSFCETMYFLHEFLILVINRDAAQVRNCLCGWCLAGFLHLKLREPPELQESRTYASRCAVNQCSPARFHVNRTMHHLVGSNVIQHQADSLGSVEPLGH